MISETVNKEKDLVTVYVNVWHMAAIQGIVG